MRVGLGGIWNVWGAANPPAPSPRRMLTEPGVAVNGGTGRGGDQLSTAASSLESPLKSARTTPIGNLPAQKFVRRAKVPSPFPKATVIEKSASEMLGDIDGTPSTETISTIPSLLTSPSATSAMGPGGKYA